MTILAFDHVNIRTARLDEMIAWYSEVLEMRPGKRPDFSFPGAWMYLGDLALVHLVDVETHPASTDPGLEHFALRAKGLRAFLDLLETRGEPYELADVPGFNILQVNIHDPDGNHIHIDFDASEPR